MSQIKLTADSGGGTTSLKAPSSTTSNADVVLKLPVADGSANQVLKTDGSGQLSFTSNAGTTINNNADNRVITGSGTASTLEGESGLTYDGNDLNISVGAHDSGMAITAANNNQETRLTITGKHSDGTSHSFLLNAKRSANRLDIVGGGSARISVDANGYVGINQASPSSELQVGGGTNPMTAKPTFHVAPSSGNAAMSLRGGSPSIYFDGTGGGHTRFLTDGTDIAISNGNLDSAGNERFRFRADGGLCFNGDTAAANALDDYEEGTWTPAATSGFSSISYHHQNGFYTKIGNVVYFTIYIYVYQATGDSNNIKISLPFTSASDTRRESGAYSTYDNATFSSSVNDKSTCTWLIGNNEDYIRPVSRTAGAAINGNNCDLGSGGNNRYFHIAGMMYV